RGGGPRRPRAGAAARSDPGEEVIVAVPPERGALAPRTASRGLTPPAQGGARIFCLPLPTGYRSRPKLAAIRVLNFFVLIGFTLTAVNGCAKKEAASGTFTGVNGTISGETAKKGPVKDGWEGRASKEAPASSKDGKFAEPKSREGPAADVLVAAAPKAGW